MIEFEDNVELNKLVQQLIKRHHSRLIDANVRVKGVLKCKTKDNEEIVQAQAERVKLVKVNPMFRDRAEADFVIVVDNYFWINHDPREREPVVNFALCGIGVENTESGPKVKVRRPDIVDYTENVHKYGAYGNHLQAVLDFARGTAGTAAAHVLTAVTRLQSKPAPPAEEEATPAPAARPSRGRRPAPVAEEDEEVLPAAPAPAAPAPAAPAPAAPESEEPEAQAAAEEEAESVPTAAAPEEAQEDNGSEAEPQPARRSIHPRIRN